MELNKIYNEDCLEGMKRIPDCSIDLVLCDLPYGRTRNEWDKPLPLDKLWKQYNRIVKPNGCVALFAQSPYDITLGTSNLKNYRYEWIIEKTKATGHLNAKTHPMKAHEKVMIFYKKRPTYNPQMTEGHSPVHNYTKHTTDGETYGKTKIGISGGGSTQRYPRSVLRFKWDTQKSDLHEAQKPIALLEYFIKTYSNPGETVLDNCIGSGSTAVAAINTGRNYIGFEIDKDYYDIANKRINEAKEAHHG